MLFEGTSVWMSPDALVGLSVVAVIIAVIAGVFTVMYLDIEGFDYPGDKAFVLTFGLAAILAATVAVIGFVQADQDRRLGQEVLAVQASEVYGVELRDTATAHLLEGRGLYDLSQGGPEQMRLQAGTVHLILDGEDVTLTLAWVDDAWLLLEGGSASEPGDELVHADGSDR